MSMPQTPPPDPWPFLSRLFSMIVLAFPLAACGPSLLERPAQPTTHSYLLEWQAGEPAPAADPAGPVLLVGPVLAAPGIDGADMAYRRRPHEIEYFAYHRWADAPARMLDPLLLRAAAHSGLFRSVVEPGAAVRADLRLESRLLQLLQLSRTDPGELQLALRVNLIDVASGRVLTGRTLRVTEPMTERGPYAGVEAANRAVAVLLSELQVFLADALDGANR